MATPPPKGVHPADRYAMQEPACPQHRGTAKGCSTKYAMTRARKVCGKPGCPHLEPCPDHPKVAWSGSTRRSRLPADWERRRRSVLARDPICRVCNNALSREVDHIQQGDDHSLTNLQGICHECHVVKSSRESKEIRGKR